MLARIGWVKIVGSIEEIVNAHKPLIGNLKVKDRFGIYRKVILKCNF
jgi:hypothetical protein